MHKGDRSKMNRIVLGIDIGKQKFDVALLIDGKFKTKVFPNTREGFNALLEWLARYHEGQVHACMEATGAYWQALAEYLYDKGHLVSSVNPGQIHAFGKGLLSRTKTDKQDAKLIALFCEAMKPALWQPRPLEERELFALVRRLEALKGMRDQEKVRLDTAHTAVVEEIEGHLAGLNRAIEVLEERIKTHIDKHPDLREKRELLESIPGIGDATVAQLLCRISTLTAMASPRKWVAHVGLSPAERSSGEKQRISHGIARLGDARLRKALYLPALVAKRYNPALKAFADRLKARGKRPKQIIVACMRKLLHVIYGVLKSGRPFSADYGMELKSASG